MSHVLVFKRDRLGRPQALLDMMKLEQELVASGVTLVTHDHIYTPEDLKAKERMYLIAGLVEYREQSWHANTVRDLCANPIIAGIREYGRRSEGRHRRVSIGGPRELEEHDLRPDGQPKLLKNPEEVRVRGASGGDVLFDPARWQAMQPTRSRRRKSGAAASSSQQVKRLSVLGNKPLNVVGASTQEICDLLCRGVSKAHLNNLWRMPTNQRPGLEIIVLRDHAEAFGSSERAPRSSRHRRP